jgi:hypothetical protein
LSYLTIYDRGGLPSVIPGSYDGTIIGGNEQTFGENQQVRHGGGCYKSGDGSGGAITPLRAALSAHAAVFYRPESR